jgi:hypothetical protein
MLLAINHIEEISQATIMRSSPFRIEMLRDGFASSFDIAASDTL